GRNVTGVQTCALPICLRVIEDSFDVVIGRNYVQIGAVIKHDRLFMTQSRVRRKWVVLIERLVAMVIGWCTGLVCDGATADGLCARHRTISFAVSDVSHLCDAHYVYCFLVCLTSPEKVSPTLPSSGSDLWGRTRVYVFVSRVGSRKAPRRVSSGMCAVAASRRFDVP